MKTNPIFILGAPRTGSTFLYQVMINYFGLSYLTNFTNKYFTKHPYIGTYLSLPFMGKVNYSSDYGKTNGLFGPSEASYIFRNWFGGEHPSETKSCNILPGKEKSLIRTFKNKTIVTKNAWNCFRIWELVNLLPDIRFIWIKRNIMDSALSDLNSRYNRGSPDIWNSATPANYKEIQKRPYWEQVVEQQHEYNRIIERDLKLYSKRYMVIQYENFYGNFNKIVNEISYFIRIRPNFIVPRPYVENLENITIEDEKRVEVYYCGKTNSKI